MVEATAGVDNTSELGKFPFDSLLDLSSILDADPDDELLPSPTMLLIDMQMAFLIHLRQPFGVLLLVSTQQNVAEYRRVAMGSLITAQVKEITAVTLNRLIQSVWVLDLL